MPVKRVGDWCASCLVRPALHDGLCRPCEELERCFPGSRRDLREMSREQFHHAVWAMIEREADPDEQPMDDYILAALREGIQQMTGVTTVQAWSLERLDELLKDRDVIFGPCVRPVHGRGDAYYAYVRKEAA